MVRSITRPHGPAAPRLPSQVVCESAWLRFRWRLHHRACGFGVTHRQRPPSPRSQMEWAFLSGRPARPCCPRPLPAQRRVAAMGICFFPKKRGRPTILDDDIIYRITRITRWTETGRKTGYKRKEMHAKAAVIVMLAAASAEAFSPPALGRIGMSPVVQKQVARACVLGFVVQQHVAVISMK